MAKLGTSIIEYIDFVNYKRSIEGTDLLGSVHELFGKACPLCECDAAASIGCQARLQFEARPASFELHVTNLCHILVAALTVIIIILRSDHTE